MSLIDDILKGLPENALLRSRVSDLVSQIADRDQLIAQLKDDGHEKDVKIATLQKENEQLTHVDEDLSEIEVALLRALTNSDVRHAEQMVGMVRSNLTRVEYHLHRLVDAKYLFSGVASTEIYYGLTQKGREYLAQQKLI